MDWNDSGIEVSEEVTRESLIAISNSVPEKEKGPTDKHSTEELSDMNGLLEAVKADGEDKYRCKLISISYSQSPDTKAQPVLPGDVKDLSSTAASSVNIAT